MKTRYLSVLLLIMVAGSSCRVLKDKQRQQEKKISKQRLEWIGKMSFNNQTQLRKASQREDSLWHQYQVTIYPLDTFRYDLKNGYNGKAVKVELRGRIRSASRRRDTLVVGANNSSTTQYSKKEQAQSKIGTLKANKLIKYNKYFPIVFLALGVLLVVVYLKKLLN